MLVSPIMLDTKLSEFWLVLTDGKGSLSFNEFYIKLKKHGVSLTLQSLKQQWDIIDVDGSDDMDLTEFTTLMKKNFEANDKKIILQNAFNDIKKKLIPNDEFDFIKQKHTTPRISSANVAIPLNSRSLKQNRKMQLAIDKKLEDVFNAIDEDGSGTLEFNEMWEAVNILEIPISEQDLKITFNFFDTDKNGHIEFPEFKRWMTSQITKYWTDGSNQYQQLQKMISATNVETIKSTKASKIGKSAFNFPDSFDDEKKNDDGNAVDDKYKDFVNCTKNVVESWNIDKCGDFVGYLFREKDYDGYRDKYVTIFMTNDIDGKKFVSLDRRKLTRMGIENTKGKRHVTIIWTQIRHLNGK